MYITEIRYSSGLIIQSVVILKNLILLKFVIQGGMIYSEVFNSYARLTLARLLATILSWQVVPFGGTNWEAPALFTTGSCIVHDKFTTSSRIVHECVPISVISFHFIYFHFQHKRCTMISCKQEQWSYTNFEITNYTEYNDIN